MTDPDTITIKGLSHWYGTGDLRRQILREIDLKVAKGSTTFLMGPSGCGKSTLLTIVGALRSVMAGSVTVLGQQLNGASSQVQTETRRRIGFVFQNHNLHRSLTVLQNVRMGLEAKGEAGARDAHDRCLDVLAAVGMTDHVNKWQDQISGGQKQRVAVARALVGRPELLLADEPTAALDRVTGRDVIELMQKLARERGMTVLMVTHDNRILDIADRILEMEDGRILPETPTAAAKPAVVQPIANLSERRTRA